MDITLFEVHLDDVVVNGGREASASTDPDTAEALEPGETSDPNEGVPRNGGVPRVLFALVPVFVVLGVAAGFLAARRLGPDPSELPDDSVGIEIETGVQ